MQRNSEVNHRKNDLNKQTLCFDNLDDIVT